MSIIIFFIILLVLVLVHEFGHFFTAKKFGIRVDEFGFGFPPKLFGIKWGETEYTFNLLPIGGFVKIFGENPDEENTTGPDSARSFVNKAKWKQAIVLLAGVFMNFMLAWVLFSFGFMSGLPTSVGSEREGSILENVNTVIISVSPESPAFKSGLKIGDKIISLKSNNSFISEINPENIKSFIANNGGEEIEVGYVRGNNEEDFKFLKVKPEIIDKTPKIGISMDEIGIAKLPFFSAFSEGMKLTVYVTKNTALGLYSLIKDALVGKGSLSAVTGPVGLVGVVGDAYNFGFAYLLSFAALISVNLAVINLVPFPALDGGRLLFLLIEKIKGSRINPKFFNFANMIGFGILILFMIFVTYHDIVKLF
jgi:regulator of sigma E protease